MPNDLPLPQTPFTIKDAVALRFRFLTLGLINITLGIATIILPRASDFRVQIIIGLALMLTGAADVKHAMLLRSKRGYILGWISSALFFAAGALIFASAFAEFTSLHFTIVLLFWIAGILRIGKGMEIRPIKSWPWVVASGSLSILFGVYIMYQGDTLSWITISLLVGINLVVDGWSRMIVFWVHE